MLLADGTRPATVTIRGERITRVAGFDDREPGLELVDLGDLVLMPGLVDSHVHVNEPGRTEWEGFETATRAAAVGGVSTIADMPLNSIPVTTTRDALQQKLRACAGQLWVDCAFWGGVVPGNTPELGPMVQAGVRGFKCFLCPSGIDEFPPAREQDLRQAMPVLKSLGVPLLVHAELELPLSQAASGSARDYATYLHSRPPEWEDRAVLLIVELCRATGARAHIVHLSSAGAVGLLRAAKAEGLPITAETCPHYLCLSAEEVPAGATEFKCAPPIRNRENRELLWSALDEGVIDFVVTDHSPCVPGLKLPDEGDFLRAWGGIASLELGLASVATEARRRGFGPERLNAWMSAGPAALLGLRRGRVEAGARADLVAWATDAERVVDKTALAQRHAVTPYAGRALLGRVEHHWLGGLPIVRDGVVLGTPRGCALGRDAR